LTVTVDYENHETGIATSVAVTAGMTTTVDFYLRELIPCVTVDSDVLETTLDIGETNNTKTIVLTNDGAEVADFSINNMVVDASYNHNEAGPYVAGDIIQSWAINLTLGWGIGFDKYMGDLWIEPIQVIPLILPLGWVSLLQTWHLMSIQVCCGNWMLVVLIAFMN